MSIARRAAAVLFALVAAHAAAALLITLCMMFEWEEIVRATGVGPGWLALGVFGLIMWKALLPALLVVVLAEGFARECYPKIEVHRPALGEPPRRWPTDPMVIAVATDAPLAVARPVRRLDLNAPREVAAFLLEHLAGTGAFSAVRAG